MFRGGIPIDLRHIVKDFVRAVPLGATFIDLEHGAILDDSRFVSRPRLRLIQISLCHRGGIVLVTALDQAVYVDIGCGHIDIPAGDVTVSRLGRIRTRVGFGFVANLFL